MANPKAALIMGSDSDFDKVKGCITKLREFDIDCEVTVISAHRTPAKAMEYAAAAEDSGIEVIICAAGMAAHLAGVVAANTTLPVIGIPIESTFNGLDAMLATVQMPPGIPVATVGLNNGTNAAILAAEMLALKYDHLRPVLKNARKTMADGVAEKDAAVKEKAAALEQSAFGARLRRA